MAKTLGDARITTPNARAKLPAGTHWRRLDPDVHIGYRKGPRGGRWVVRWYRGSGAYEQATIGTADDALPSDGQTTLSFSQAERLAREHVGAARTAAAAKAAGPVATVRSAIDAYLTTREAREAARSPGQSLKRDARSRLTRHVLSDEKLADKALHELTEADLGAWCNGLGNMAPATRARLRNDLRAALNAAARAHRARLPASLPATIREGLADARSTAPSARGIQVLPDADIRRIISAAAEVDREGSWEGDLERLILVLAATGARFSQVARLTVADVQSDRFRIMVPPSAKGGGGVKATRIGVRVGDDVLATLRPAIVGRPGTEPLLERWRWKQVAVAQWEKERRGAWTSASELTRPWATILEQAGLAKGVVPYALRHSSIVRGLRVGLPVRHVAALHDTSSAMIERHYAAYIVDALDEMAAAAVVPLTTAPAQVVAVGERK